MPLTSSVSANCSTAVTFETQKCIFEAEGMALKKAVCYTDAIKIRRD